MFAAHAYSKERLSRRARRRCEHVCLFCWARMGEIESERYDKYFVKTYFHFHMKGNCSVLVLIWPEPCMPLHQSVERLRELALVIILFNYQIVNTHVISWPNSKIMVIATIEGPSSRWEWICISYAGDEVFTLCEIPLRSSTTLQKFPSFRKYYECYHVSEIASVRVTDAVQFYNHFQMVNRKTNNNNSKTPRVHTLNEFSNLNELWLRDLMAACNFPVIFSFSIEF